MVFDGFPKLYVPSTVNIIDFNPESSTEIRIYFHPKKLTVVCKIVHKFASVWCKTGLGEVGVSLP
jgi:hypothetical protein